MTEALVEEVTLGDKLPLHPRLDGWTAIENYTTYCSSCGNVLGLFEKNGDVQCSGCICYGHPSFVPEHDGPLGSED